MKHLIHSELSVSFFHTTYKPMIFYLYEIIKNHCFENNNNSHEIHFDSILILIGGTLKATPELDEYSVKGKHITINVTYRYPSEIQKLYYQSLIKNLDTYIDGLKENGKLDRGKIHFEIMTGIWMDDCHGVEMYRSKNGYYCWLNGLVQPITQDYMTKIITYFASDKWESFCYDHTKLTPRVALQVFNQRIDTINVSHQFNSHEAVKLKNTTIYFENGSLICKSSKETFGQISEILPFSVGTKDFVTVGETIYVIEDETVINKTKLGNIALHGAPHIECWADAFDKWVNFKNTSGCFLSYSISKNKFHKLNR